MSPSEQDLETRALQWFASKAPAFVVGGADPTPWLDRLTQLFFRAVRLSTPLAYAAGPWELHLADSPTLEPAPESATGAKVLFPVRECEVRISHLVRLARQGVRRAWFFESADGWTAWDLRGLLAWRGVRRCAGSRWCPVARWLGLGRKGVQFAVARGVTKLFGGDEASRWHPARAIDSAWDALGATFPTPRTPLTNGVDSVVHYTGALFSGGAERQLCNVAVGQARRGQRVRVHTAYPPTGDRAHYAPVLEAARIPLSRPEDGAGRGAARVPWSLTRLLPIDLARQVAELTATLLDDPPDVLHCWLDEPNVIGALGGLLAGVPRIVLSTRNSNPTNFPRLLTPYLLPLYRLVAHAPTVHFIANSHSGAASYAEWIGVPLSRFHVVFNGVRLDHFPTPTVEGRRSARAALGLSSDVPVICGVFRLAAEKQPQLFLDVVRRVRAAVPAVKVLLVGDGDLAPEVDREIRETGLTDCVLRLGRRRDVETIYLAADVTLLTSLLEGCPNVALESQHLGVPVVATAGGGTTDAILHGRTGYLAGVSDAAALATHLIALLSDATLRTRMGQAGPGVVASRFGLEHMIDQTQAVYRAALGGLGIGRVLPPALAA